MSKQMSYDEIAHHCSRFNSQGSHDSFTNSATDGSLVNCQNCTHFKNNHCNLDLIDKINQNHSL